MKVYVLPDVKDEAVTTKIKKLLTNFYNLKVKNANKAQNTQNKTDVNNVQQQTALNDCTDNLRTRYRMR